MPIHCAAAMESSDATREAFRSKNCRGALGCRERSRSRSSREGMVRHLVGCERPAHTLRQKIGGRKLSRVLSVRTLFLGISVYVHSGICTVYNPPKGACTVRVTRRCVYCTGTKGGGGGDEELRRASVMSAGEERFLPCRGVMRF